jgi:hypothetical protein
MLNEKFDRRLPHEGRITCQQFEQDDPKRVDICAIGRSLASALFRSHVADCPKESAVFR